MAEEADKDVEDSVESKSVAPLDPKTEGTLRSKYASIVACY